MRSTLLLLTLSALAHADSSAPSPAAGKNDSLVACATALPGDADGDGIPDDADKCPHDPETWNGVDDGDGCPDKGRLTASRDRIELLAPISFEAGKAELAPGSRPLIEALAVALAHVCGAPHVEVQVHSDARGAGEFNLRITQARAEAIVKTLISLGVPSARLRARGYGETKPLCSESNEACWSRNRRSEIVRLPLK